MTVITMSHKELGRIQILIDLADGRIGVAEAGALMGLGRRQVYRVLTSFQAHGPDALVSKRRGKPSNRSHGAVFRKTILGIVRERYGDFGPTLAAEKLAELHGLPIGVETLRQWMIDDEIWTRRRDRAKRSSDAKSLISLKPYFSTQPKDKIDLCRLAALEKGVPNLD